jgi:hypothetical protein
MDAQTEGCDWCRTMAASASALRGITLGANERRVLLQAAPPGGDPVPVRPAGTHAWQQTALRRSVASLRSKKLIVLARDTLRVTAASKEGEQVLASLRRKQYAVFRLAWRTSLGEAVLDAYRRELETGTRIRWPQRLDEVRAQALAACPHATEHL